MVKIEGNIAHVEDEDGFEIPVLIKECVVVDDIVQPAANTYSTTHKSSPAPASATKAEVPAKVSAVPSPAADIDEEMEGGDKINLVLAFEPEDPKRLSDTTFDAVLVNDSNYYVLFTYLVRPNDTDKWETRYAGVIEPHIQLIIDTVTRENVNSLDNLRVDAVFYKLQNSFEAKPVRSMRHKFDNTRFFKLHAYRSNPYFDSNVIAVDLINDDMPVNEPKLNAESLEHAMRQKRNNDRRPVQKRQLKKSAVMKGDTLEVDLHINEIIDNINGLSPADILNLQIDEFRRVMDANAHNKGQKIIFIHGKGDGVLRNALLKELTHRYKGNDVQDASFQEYGYGATQIKIR